MAIHFNKYRLKCVNDSSKTINNDGVFEAKFEVIFRNADKSEIMEYLAGLTHYHHAP